MIVNQTKNDLELNTLASKYISGKARIWFFVISLVFMAIGVLSFCLEYFLPSEEGPDYFFGIFFMAFGVILLVFDVFFYTLLLKGLSKKYMDGKYSDCRYTFTEEGYTWESVITDGEATSRTQGGYASITQVSEYDDLWLIYLNKSTIFALRKSGMVEGTADDLSALLRSQLGPRYKTFCKKK